MRTAGVIRDRGHAWLEQLGGSRAIVLAIPLGVFILRLVMVWALPVSPLSPDCREYAYLSERLDQEGRYGFREDWREDRVLCGSAWSYLYDGTGMVRPPGYPLLLAAVRRGMGVNTRDLQVLGAMAEALTALLIYACGRIMFSAGTGMLAGIIYMGHPGMNYAMGWLGREPFLALAFSLGVFGVILAAHRDSIGPAVLAGLCFGVAGYLKETLTVAGGLAGLWLLWVGWRARSRLVWGAVLMLLVAALTWVPWLVRNARACGTWTGMSNLGGTALWLGLVDPNWKTFDASDEVDWTAGLAEEQRTLLDPRLAPTALEADKRLKAMVMKQAVERPADMARAMGRNALIFWSPVSRTVIRAGSLFRRPLEFLSAPYYLGIFALFLAGLWVGRHRQEVWLAAFVLGGITALHATCCAYPRYRFPFDGMVVILAAFALTTWIGKRASCSADSAGGTGGSSGRSTDA